MQYGKYSFDASTVIGVSEDAFVSANIGKVFSTMSEASQEKHLRIVYAQCLKEAGVIAENKTVEAEPQPKSKGKGKGNKATEPEAPAEIIEESQG